MGAIADRSATALDIEVRGEGRALVLLHSMLSDRSTFNRIMPRLTPHRRVVMPNLPGYGRSPLRESSVAEMAARLAEALQEIGLQPGETDVLGNGLGGFVATALATRHGLLFNKLVLVDCGAGFPPQGREAVRLLADRAEREGMAAVVEAALLRLFPAEFLAANPDIAAERRAVLLGFNAARFARICRMLAEVDLAPELRSIRNPTLVVFGGRDEATTPAMARVLHSGIPGATLQELPDCGHSPHIQEPDKLLAIVGPFLGLRNLSLPGEARTL